MAYRYSYTHDREYRIHACGCRFDDYDGDDAGFACRLAHARSDEHYERCVEVSISVRGGGSGSVRVRYR
ncbi:hypothetical protein ESCO_001179 [Escovopsis weberi]|uniref:Uncharacterized protein n=1 Tax=Escovopsis weberi TaxID=150374 RepID=A0A0M8N3U4_ESCWE|nr:hypothetical protein ESCO_001179 [Escovopsis weberi]